MYFSNNVPGINIKRFLRLLFVFCTVFIVASSFAQRKQTIATGASIKKQRKPVANFIAFFPDTVFAAIVAQKLGRNVTDAVTSRELAALKGDLEIAGGGIVRKLTGIGYLTGLNSINCYKNEITELPLEIGKLGKLVSLSFMKEYELEKIPPEIGKLVNLTELNFSETSIKYLPKEIGNLTNLQILDVCCCNLTTVPKEIGSLKNLVDLDIHSNEIGSIPDELCNLTSPKNLDLLGCGLKRLPDSIGNLHALESLDLFGNDIRHLPKSIASLDNLTYLNVYDNFKLSESYKQYLPKHLQKKKKG